MIRPPEKTEDSIALDALLKSAPRMLRMAKADREAFLKKQLKKLQSDVERHELLQKAVQYSNLPLVRALLSDGADPNRSLIPDPPYFDALLKGALKIAKVQHTEHPKSEAFYVAREIAQLLWIHKGIMDFSAPCTRSSESIKSIRDNIDQQFPGILDLNHPALGFCYAVHSALQIPGRQGADWGRTLFSKMLDKLNTNRAEVLRLVAEELNREERKYPGDLRAPISLITDHFHCDLLREISRDQTLTVSLGIDTTESIQFDHQLKSREAIKQSVLNKIQSYIINAYAIVRVGGSGPQ